MQSWLIAIPYLAVFGAMLGFSWLWGGWCLGLLMPKDGRSRRPSVASPVFLLAVQMATGLATVSYASAILGMVGAFNRTALSGALGVSAIASLGQWKRSLRVLRGATSEIARLFDAIRAAGRFEKALMLLVGAGALLFFYSQLIGALVPDMNQDPQWYHLPVPQQWVFDGAFNTYPGVMPSLYPLAAEAVYASVFLWWLDPVICSLLVVCCSAIFLLALVGVLVGLTQETETSPVVAVAMALVGWVAVASVFSGTPMQPKNDAFVVMWLFLGSTILWLPVWKNGALPGFGAVCISGFLLATGASAKPVGLPLIAFQGLCLAVLWWRRLPAYKLLPVWLLAFGAGLLPWVVRGLLGTGMPLFPLSILAGAVPPDFQPALDAYRAPMPKPDGVVEWLRHLQAIPRLFAEAANDGQFLLFLYVLISGLGLAVAPRVWKIYAVMLLFQLSLILASNNKVVFRLLAPTYALVLPLAAALVPILAPRLRPPWRRWIAVGVVSLLYLTVAHRQRLTAQMATFQWKFRPVLSRSDVARYASHAEMGWAFLDLIELQKVIDPRERVLVVGLRYGFYLHRSMLWNDEVVGDGGPQDRWRKATPEQALSYLADERIDVVLMPQNDPGVGIARELSRGGLLSEVALAPDLQEKWVVFRVNQTSSSSPSGSFSPPDIPNFSRR